MSNTDRLVAEKVMGWTVRADTYGSYYGNEFGRAVPVEKWSPSTDMNAAMEVVAKVVSTLPVDYRDGCDFSLQKWGNWEAYFGSNKEDENLGLATHANPATAICLAALAAVGHKEDASPTTSENAAVGVEYKESKDE